MIIRINHQPNDFDYNELAFCTGRIFISNTAYALLLKQYIAYNAKISNPGIF